MRARNCVLPFACLALVVPATAQAADPPPRTVTAIAAARITLKRDLPRNNAAIRAAVERARMRAIPMALANARTQAERLATAAGLTLGGVVGLEEMIPPHFGHWAYGTDGTFGPGKFCGTVRTRRFKRLANGRRIPTGPVRSRFTCRIPTEVQHTVKVTYAVT